MSLILLTIKGISYSQTQNGAYALVLHEVGGDRTIPIVIGAFEAQAIAIAMEKEITPPRPLTHDLFKNFADCFHIQLKKVLIHKLVDGVFFSSIVCERDGIEEAIDARTSDAIALALRFAAPIFTYPNILDKAGVSRKSNSSATDNELADDILAPLTEVEEDDDAETNSSPYNHYSIAELYESLDIAIQEEDYEKAARLRDELDNREDQTMPNV
ncbi:MAG: bifunctional nuclease family protein [Flavobacterium sp.]|jgi:bifunctional DNase/RNase|nr:bifunctional nuclease family protein [Flavobacterium sp.]